MHITGKWENGKMGKWENQTGRANNAHLSILEPNLEKLLQGNSALSCPFHFCVHIIFSFFLCVESIPPFPPCTVLKFTRKLRRYLYLFNFVYISSFSVFFMVRKASSPLALTNCVNIFGHYPLPHNTHHRFGIFSRPPLCDVLQVLTRHSGQT